MMRRLYFLLFLLFASAPAYAVGTMIAVGVMGLAAGSFAAVAVAFAINMVASAIISKAFFSPNQPDPNSIGGNQPNPGNRQQLPPATDNKLPVVYGSAYVGGIITDLSITSDNQEMYYVISLSEVTNNGADTITFGDMYWGGKKVIFDGATYQAIGQVTAISGATVYLDGLAVSPSPTSKITFANTGTPTQYVCQSVYSDSDSISVTLSTNVSGVSVGATAYLYDPNASVNVTALYDESTSTYDYNIKGKMQVYFYRNGSNAPANSSLTAIQVMQASNLVYKWDTTKLMTNCAFAIVHLTYNNDAGTTSLQQTRFQLTNSRYAPGDVFYDYMTNTVYGAALPASQIDTASLTALNTYSAQPFTYTNANGATATQARFRFDGVLQTNVSVMSNLQAMSTCCDCLLKYNEIIGKWGVIVQSPDYDIAMNLTDSNMVSSITISPLDISASYNIVECKFPNGTSQDAFDTATFDLAEIAPALLFQNEPINKMSLNLPLVSNSVRAQYIATRTLKSAREDLQVTVSVGFSGIQLEAGDIVTITNANYGWTLKEFRVNKVVEEFTDQGQVTAKLTLSEFNAAVYDDTSITAFQPAPNTGIGNPTQWGTVPTPTIGATYPSAPIPSITINAQASSSGIIQYAEIWYSAFASPASNQLIFGGTTAIQSSGTPYAANSALPAVNLGNIPQGNWYFFSRMVNSLGSSQFSLASAIVNWRPLTFQYTDRYLAVRYADSATGAGMTTNPRNKTYFGLQNTTVATGSTNPADYVWYAGTFGTDNYLLYSNRSNRKFSFAVGGAGFNNLGGAFVPSATSVYDTSLWGALQDSQNYIDLDVRTGQLTQAGTTVSSSADGLLAVSNNTSGSMIISLEKFLNFGNGVYSKTFNAATLTIDVFGRVVGFSQPDGFYFTEQIFTATSGQTTFTFPHIVGNILVFRDGLLVPTSEFNETSANFTLTNACVTGEIIIVIYMRAVSTSQYYEILNTTISTSTSNTITYTSPTPQAILAGDVLCFANTQPESTDTPTTYTVQSVNTATKQITFTTTIAGASAGFGVYRKRAAGANYAPWTRYTATFSAATSYTPTNFAFLNGFESVYVNGVQLNEADYDLSGNTINGFPAPITGGVDIIMYAPNNYNVPASNVTNNTAYSNADALTYVFPNNPLSMELYANGAILTKGSGNDYVPTSAGYNLVTAFPNNFTLLNQQTFARDGAA